MRYVVKNNLKNFFVTIHLLSRDLNWRNFGDYLESGSKCFFFVPDSEKKNKVHFEFPDVRFQSRKSSSRRTCS